MSSALADRLRPQCGRLLTAWPPPHSKAVGEAVGDDNVSAEAAAAGGGGATKSRCGGDVGGGDVVAWSLGRCELVRGVAPTRGVAPIRKKLEATNLVGDETVRVRNIAVASGGACRNPLTTRREGCRRHCLACLAIAWPAAGEGESEAAPLTNLATPPATPSTAAGGASLSVMISSSSMISCGTQKRAVASGGWGVGHAAAWSGVVLL